MRRLTGITAAAAALLLVGCSEGVSDTPSATPSTANSPAVATTPTATPESTEAASQTVAGKFAIMTAAWVETIPNTEHDDCGNQDGKGADSCSGLECYGVGPADGLDFGTAATVTNADGTKVGLGELEGSRATSRNDCWFEWSVDVPSSETGVLTVTFDDNPNWTADFTLEQMREQPGRLNFISIGA